VPPAHCRYRVVPYSGYFGYVSVTAAAEAAVQSSHISVSIIGAMVDVEDRIAR